jgi:hypothetical protein
VVTNSDPLRDVMRKYWTVDESGKYLIFLWKEKNDNKKAPIQKKTSKQLNIVSTTK